MSSLPHLWRRFLAQLNVAFNSTRNYCVYEQRTQASHHANYAFIVSSLLQFLHLMYQGKPDSPFNTHPRTIRVAITSLLMHGLAHEAQLRFPWARLPPSYASIVDHAVRFIGSVSVASLASVLVPDSAQPVLYLIYLLPSAAVFFQWFKSRVMDGVGEPDSWSGHLRRVIRLLWRVQGDWSGYLGRVIRLRGVQGDRYTLPLCIE